MTTTDAPEPEDPNEKLRSYIDDAKPVSISPEALAAMRSSIQRWVNDDVVRNAAAVLGKAPLRVEPRSIPDERVSEEAAKTLADSVDMGHALAVDATQSRENAAESDKKAAASERRAKINMGIAIFSAIIAALALFGALPQGIAAIPEAWAVITGDWPPPHPTPSNP